MSITTIQAIQPMVTMEAKRNTQEATGFSSILNEAQNLLDATRQAQEVTNEKTYDFIVNDNDNIHELMIAQEKSSILLQYTTQVRNNVLEAYQEVMRISL